MKPEQKKELRDELDKVDSACQQFGLAVIRTGRIDAFRAHFIQLREALQGLHADMEEQ